MKWVDWVDSGFLFLSVALQIDDCHFLFYIQEHSLGLQLSWGFSNSEFCPLPSISFLRLRRKVTSLAPGEQSGGLDRGDRSFCMSLFLSLGILMLVCCTFFFLGNKFPSVQRGS